MNLYLLSWGLGMLGNWGLLCLLILLFLWLCKFLSNHLWYLFCSLFDKSNWWKIPTSQFFFSWERNINKIPRQSRESVASISILLKLPISKSQKVFWSYLDLPKCYFHLKLLFSSKGKRLNLTKIAEGPLYKKNNMQFLKKPTSFFLCGLWTINFRDSKWREYWKINENSKGRQATL